MAVDATADRLVVSDSSHHRIVEMDLSGMVRQVIGTGKHGNTDRAIAQAQLNRPQGVTLDSDIL